MKHVKRAHEAQIEPIVDRLRDASDEIERARIAANAAISAMNEKIEAYNEVLGDARDLKEEIVGTMNDYESERSDKWRESTKGAAFLDWVAGWNDLDFDDVPLVDDVPETDTPHADALASADTSAPEVDDD